ncbi:unnamed protein product [Sphenostylis stenocarpa]|uniref:Uncharacterized protein n=1 Tax=Sphenostylis stenocarpa TaxID=92480 RepID=A0AA86SXL7_9FABA|nr:unnamed protein product [Sphenostylis stenocarpa]
MEDRILCDVFLANRGINLTPVKLNSMRNEWTQAKGIEHNIWGKQMSLFEEKNDIKQIETTAGRFFFLLTFQNLWNMAKYCDFNLDRCFTISRVKLSLIAIVWWESDEAFETTLYGHKNSNAKFWNASPGTLQ